MKTHKFIVFAAITVLALAASGCSTSSRCSASRDTWYTDLIDYERNAADVPFAEVMPDLMAAVVSRLDVHPAIELTAEEARQLTKQSPPDASNLKPYLVRALSYRQGTGAYSVSLGEKALYVSYNMLGKSNCYPVYREGIVVWLVNPPVAINISTGIAE